MTSAKDWLDLAEADIELAKRALTPPELPSGAAYHVQQAAEKIVKAILVHEGVRYPRGARGHIIAESVDRILDTRLKRQAKTVEGVSPWATVFRYPSDDPATKPPAPTASEVMTELSKVEALLLSATTWVAEGRP